MSQDESTKVDHQLEVVRDYVERGLKINAETGLESEWSQTGRTYKGKHYRVIVAEYGKDPVTKLQAALNPTPARPNDTQGDHIVDANKMILMGNVAKELHFLRDSVPCTCGSGSWPCVSCRLYYLAEAMKSEDGKAGPYDLEAEI